MGSMGTHLPFNPFAFVLEGGEKERERERKKISSFFFERKKKRKFVFSTLSTRRDIDRSRVLLRGYGTIFDIDCFRSVFVVLDFNVVFR